MKPAARVLNIILHSFSIWDGQGEQTVLRRGSTRQEIDVAVLWSVRLHRCGFGFIEDLAEVIIIRRNPRKVRQRISGRQMLRFQVGEATGSFPLTNGAGGSVNE